MRLNPGAQLGRYEILDRIGNGGMGEVYRARDTRLDKVVAIKIIASAFVDDPTAAPRFESERKLTAALEHPHVCRLLDAGREDGVTYLAMEYLEGESLSDRLTRGGISVQEALGHAIEIAEALSYAHGRGVIHRDLKPANVFITATGVKVLDFGLAKLRQSSTSASPSVADTAPLTMTSPGTLIGSALYMAPERLEGAEADERTDIFSFGLVLYEMLAGQPAFHGRSTAALIAAVLTSEPPPLPPLRGGDEEIEWLVRKCLAKSPDDRWHSMRDVAAVLKRLARPRPVLRRAESSRRSTLVAGLIVLLLATGVPVWRWFALPDESVQAPLVFRVEPPPEGGFTPTNQSAQTPMLALAPDGRSLAYVAAGADGVSQIWIRQFDTLAPRSVPGTTDAMFPFWAPDGKTLGFFSRGFLKRVDLAGGPARSLAPVADPCGGTWSESGVILFAPKVRGGLQRVSANGGEVVNETEPDSRRGETSHRWPRFIGNGSQFIYFARSTQEQSEGVYLGSLDSSTSKLLARTYFGGEFLPPNRLLYISEGTLLAQPFDPTDGAMSGEPVAIADRVAGSSNFYPAFSAARTGTLAYATVAWTSELTWVGRSGERLSVAGRGAYVDFRLSPDNRHLAVAETDPRTGHPDVYLLDLERGTRERLTSTRVTDATPMWSPDGLELLFRSNRETVHDLYQRTVFGTAPERPFLKNASAKFPTSWSGDGRVVLFHAPNDETGWDIWATAADGSGRPRPVIQTRFNEAQAHFSPDGRWVAYAAEEDSSLEVYVQQFTGGTRRWRISTAGGSDPRWNPDGSELFYVAADRWLMAVPLARGGGMQPGAPRRLFEMPDVRLVAPYPSLYDVGRDGTRFLVRIPSEDLRTVPLTVAFNARAAPAAQ